VISAIRAGTTESEELIRFAYTWAPYGGPPEEELLVKYGMSQPRFVNQLWQTISEGGYDPEIIRKLRAAYTPRAPR
jgi:hypothetical protein